MSVDQCRITIVYSDWFVLASDYCNANLISVTQYLINVNVFNFEKTVQSCLNGDTFI